MQFLSSVILCNQLKLTFIKFQCISVDDRLNTTNAADLSMGETESNSEYTETEAIESTQIY